MSPPCQLSAPAQGEAAGRGERHSPVLSLGRPAGQENAPGHFWVSLAPFYSRRDRGSQAVYLTRCPHQGSWERCPSSLVCWYSTQQLAGLSYGDQVPASLQLSESSGLVRAAVFMRAPVTSSNRGPLSLAQTHIFFFPPQEEISP